jgi:hypothetical protein
MTWHRALLVLAVAALSLSAGAAGAAVLQVGPEEKLTTPSRAARVAKDGDTIVIAPGEYYDCAVWPQSNLVITGPEDPATPAVLTDMTCQGKALFVVMGRDVSIRHLTFARARVIDGNGAGIRAEGHGLAVSHSRFVNNQAGIVSAPQPEAMIAVTDSVFSRIGAAIDGRCASSVQTGPLGVLRIERSVFEAPRACDVVRSWAARTEIIDSRFDEGARGAAQAMVAVEGGALLVRDSVFVRGPAAAGDAAIEVRALWGEGVERAVTGSVLENGSGRRQMLVRAVAAGPVRLEGNRVAAGDAEHDGSGLWMARARSLARDALDTARKVAGRVKRAVRDVLPF